MKIISNFGNFYICDRKQCNPCNPSCQLTTDIKHAVEPNKPMNFGDDVTVVELERKSDNG